MARHLLWRASVWCFIAFIAAQTPDILDLVDRLDVLPLDDVASVESLLAQRSSVSTELQLDLSDLPIIPSRRRAIGVVVRYFDAWREALDQVRRDRGLELVLVVDLAAWWLPAPEPGAPPLLERERRARCEAIPGFGPTPLLAAYYRASWRALACEEVQP